MPSTAKQKYWRQMTENRENKSKSPPKAPGTVYNSFPLGSMSIRSSDF